MTDFLAKIDALIAEDRKSESDRSALSERENSDDFENHPRASEWEASDTERIQLLDKAMLLLFQLRPTIETLETPVAKGEVDRTERNLARFSAADADAVAGRTVTDEELSHIGKALEFSSMGEAFAEVVQSIAPNEED